MVVPEPFVVRAVTRLVDIEKRQHQPRLLVVATHAARCLDVLGMGLRLTKDEHQAEPGDVELHRDHVRGNGAVHALLDIVEANPQTSARLSNLVSRDARRELHDLRERPAVLEETAVFADPLAGTVRLDRVLNLFLENSPRSTEAIDSRISSSWSGVNSNVSESSRSKTVTVAPSAKVSPSTTTFPSTTVPVATFMAAILPPKGASVCARA